MASTNQQIIANLYQVFTADAGGNITGINITNVTSGSSNLGPIANVKITGGTSGQLLSTDGAGNLTFTTISAATGNIAGLNLNGNGSQVLAGNGAWIPAATGSGTGNIGNTNYSGNGQQYLNGVGVWSQLNLVTGNIANTNYSGNAQTYLNGVGVWAGIPGITVGNVAYANFTGNAAQVLSGANTWIAAAASGNISAVIF